MNVFGGITPFDFFGTETHPILADSPLSWFSKNLFHILGISQLFGGLTPFKNF